MTAEPLTAPPPIILYDGECGLCSASVHYLLDQDRSGRLRFATLQGETGQAALARHGYQSGGSAVSGQGSSLDSLCVILDMDLPTERLLIESRAVLYVARCLGGWRALLGVLAGLVPPALADCFYRAIARRRHRHHLAPPACLLPNADTDSRFLP